ncbi:hypothetical protein Tco_0074113 [Tanacetum coccineum]
MPLEQFQVNTKFLNTLPDEWSKFVTDVKLVKDLHTTNVDQLHAYLEQHERHANEVRLMHERNSDPLALVASHQITQSPYQTHQHTYQNTQLQPPASTYPSPQYGSPYQSQQYSTHQSSTPLSCTKPKRKRDDSWFKEKVLLVQAQAHGQIQMERELAFFWQNPEIPEVALMANLSHYGSDALAESVNETLTAELERYKEQVKVLKKGQNVTLRSTDNISDTVHKETFTLAGRESFQNALKHKNSVNSSEPTLSISPTNVEVPKELPKVSMVNTSLKKLKHHLANFDVVVKERTTPTAITEGSWGFEHTKACFRDEIIPFVKALKDLFNTFNQYLVDELSEVQNVFHQMEQAVEQHRIESKTFEVKMNQVLNKNERLLAQVISKDIVNIIVNSTVDNAYVNVHECQKCLKLETKLQTDFIEKEIYDNLFKSFTTLEKHCISLEVDTQLNQEIFQRDNCLTKQSASSFDQLFELNELKAQS